MYHSLSLLQDLQEMKNTRRKKKNTNLNYPKLQNGDKNYSKLLHILCSGTPGGIYMHQGNGGQGTTPGLKPAARRGHVVAARVAFRAARVAFRAARSPFCLLSVLYPVSGLQPLVLTESVS